VRRIVAVTIALTAGLIATGLGFVANAAGVGTDHALGPGLVTVNLDIEHSKYSVDELRVKPGTTVRFLVHNHDPILHELVLGPESVHQHHETGTEKSHPPVPGEVTVQPGQTGETVYVFDAPSRLLFACHLPSHFQFGMRGDVTVVPG